MAVPFDLQRLEVTGQPVPVVGNVMQAANIHHGSFNTGAGQFSISDSGWLVYAAGGILPDLENSLVWVDQKGKAQPIARLSELLFRTASLSRWAADRLHKPSEKKKNWFGSMTSIGALRAD